MMTQEKRAKIEELRLRFQELSRQLERIRREWLEAHVQKDIDDEARLIREETDVFDQVNKVIAEFTRLMDRRPETR